MDPLCKFGWLQRCVTARGSCTGLVTVDPAEVKDPHLDISPKSKAAIELHSRAAQSVEAMSTVLTQEEIPEEGG